MDKKGSKKCHMKDIPEEKIKQAAAEVLGLEEFDEVIFTEEVSLVTVPEDFKLNFLLTDGLEVAKAWRNTAKVDCWTPERRAAWGEYQRKTKNGRWTPEARKKMSDELKARYTENPNWNNRRRGENEN